MRAGSRRWLWCLGMFLRFFFFWGSWACFSERISSSCRLPSLWRIRPFKTNHPENSCESSIKKRKRREVTNSKNPAVYTNIILRSSTFFSYVSFSIFLIDRSRAKNSTFMWWRKISFNAFFLFFRHILALLIPPLPMYFHSIIFFFLLSDSDSGSHHPVSIYASSAMSLAFSRVVLKPLILTRSRDSMAEQCHTPSLWLWNCIAENYTNESKILFWFYPLCDDGRVRHCGKKCLSLEKC